jgi:hypothetical protein
MVSLEGVELGASLAPGSISRLPADQVAVGLSGVEARPNMASWVFDQMPALSGFGYWLAGGMRAGLDTIHLTDASGTDLVPALPPMLQPDEATGPPLSGTVPDGWGVDRATDGTVVLVSPPYAPDQYRVTIPLLRPSATVLVLLGKPIGGPAIDIVVAPDRRRFEIISREADGTSETLVGGPFTYRRSVFGWSQALVREVGRSWLVALALVAIARLVALSLRASTEPTESVLGELVPILAASVAGLATLALAALCAIFVLESMPHTLESVAYVFQAQIFSLGGLWAAAPPVPELFEEPYVLAQDDRWYGVLAPGQSLLLALGMRTGAAWAITPLLAGLAVALTVPLGRATFGRTTGSLAGLFLMFSPFVLLLSGDMLPQPAALLFTVLLGLGVVLARSQAPRAGNILAGFAAGGLLLTRPLAALGVGLPLLVVMLWDGFRAGRVALGGRAMGLLIGAAVPLICFGYVNAMLTGNPLLSPALTWSAVDRLGFGPDVGTRGGHDLASALGNTWANTVVMERHLFGWPTYLTLALVLVPFVLVTRHRWDWILLASAFGLAAAQLLYWSDGIVYGPRFAFEAVAALALLTARGAAVLAVPPVADPISERVVAKPAAESEPPPVAERSGAPTLSEPRPDFAESPTLVEVAATQSEASTLVDHAPTSMELATIPKPAPEPDTVSPAEASPTLVTKGPARRLTAAPFAALLIAWLVAVDLVGYLPDVVLAYNGYNGMSRAEQRLVEDAGLHQAIVFVTSNGTDWQSYGQVFLLNGPLLDGDIIYARNLGDVENYQLIGRYPERSAWLLENMKLTEIRP